MAKWPQVLLGELAADEKSAISKPYGSAILKEDYRSTGVPVVRGVNLAQGVFLDDDFVFIDDDVAARMPGAELRAGDLVVTHRGTVGQVSMIPRRPRFERYVASTSHVKVRLDPHKAVAEFYYYWFTSPYGRYSILRNTSIVGVPGIAQPVATVKRLQVPRPPMPVQRAIADVLGALDDKIAANARLCGLVDKVVAAEFQQLSDDRSAAELAEIAEVNRRVTKPIPGGALRYLDISSVGRGNYDFPEMSLWDDAPGRARRVLTPGDTIWSTVRPNRRSHALVLDDDPLLIASTGLAVLTPKAGRIAGLYEASRTDDFVSYLESVAEGSAYPAVRADRFLEGPIPALGAAEWASFEAFALPLRKRAHAAAVESRRLAVTRDELLPLLVSGKVHVKGAQEVVEGAL